MMMRDVMNRKSDWIQGRISSLKDEIKLMQEQRDMWDDRIDEAHFQLDRLLEELKRVED